MERVAWVRYARCLLVAVLLSGSLALPAGPGVRVACAVEAKSPVIKPVEDPKAGNPDDPDFGPLNRGPRALPNDTAVRSFVEEDYELHCVLEHILSDLWTCLLQMSSWGQK